MKAQGNALGNIDNKSTSPARAAQLSITNRFAIHFSIIVVSRRNLAAMATFTLPPSSEKKTHDDRLSSSRDTVRSEYSTLSFRAILGV